MVLILPMRGLERFDIEEIHIYMYIHMHILKIIPRYLNSAIG